MAKQITQTVYRYNELDLKIRNKIRETDKNTFRYPWCNEALESLKKLANHFGGRLREYTIDWDDKQRSWATFNMPKQEVDKELIEDLGSYDSSTYKGLGDCKLTGCCFDEYAIDGLRKEYYTNPEATIEDLMQAAFKSWLKACQEDFNDTYSDSRYSEYCNANDYWFYKNGDLVYAN